MNGKNKIQLPLLLEKAKLSRSSLIASNLLHKPLTKALTKHLIFFDSAAWHRLGGCEVQRSRAQKMPGFDCAKRVCSQEFRTKSEIRDRNKSEHDPCDIVIVISCDVHAMSI